ncbi:MAG: ZIP family metal transporter [Casimicrobiaceae bacterium]
MTLLHILIAALAGGILSTIAAAVTLNVQATWIPGFVSFAVGALLGAVFLELLPHALESGNASSVMATVLAGLLAFFLLEKLVLWRHAHGHAAHSDLRQETEHEHALHAHPADGGRSGLMILIGNSVHSFCDGIVIAAAFLADDGLGVATTLAIVAHAVPQQVGDFAVLLHSGFARGKAFAYNVATGVATLVGALAAYGALADIAAAPAHGTRDCRGEAALRCGRRSDTKPAPAPGTGRNAQADALDRTRHRDHRGRALAARTALT